MVGADTLEYIYSSSRSFNPETKVGVDVNFVTVWYEQVPKMRVWFYSYRIRVVPWRMTLRPCILLRERRVFY